MSRPGARAGRGCRLILLLLLAVRVLLALLRRERCSLDRRKDIRLRQTVLGLQQLLRGFNFHEQHLHVLTEECSTLYIEEFEENLRDFVKKLKSTRKIKPPSLREDRRGSARWESPAGLDNLYVVSYRRYAHALRRCFLIRTRGRAQCADCFSVQGTPTTASRSPSLKEGG